MSIKILNITTQTKNAIYMNADMINNKKLNQIVAELFITEKTLNISTVFITHNYFTLPKSVRLNCTHFFYYEN